MQHKTKILIYLAVWRRPAITEICFAGIKRLQRHPDFNIKAHAVISEESMIPLCERYGITYVMYPNDPLGAKKNFGLQSCREIEFDYLMEIGSDDLVLDALLDSYKDFIAGGIKFFGIRDAGYIDTESGYCTRLISNSTYGAGRMIHRDLLDKMYWRLWKDNLNKGLDNNSVFAFMRQGIGYLQVEPMAFPGVVDLKSQENIWKFRYDLGVPYDIDNILCRLSDEERVLINVLIQQASVTN